MSSFKRICTNSSVRPARIATGGWLRASNGRPVTFWPSSASSRKASRAALKRRSALPLRPFQPKSEAEILLRGYLSGELYRRGLICRADDRGDPVIQLSPPLIAGPEQFREIEAILRPVLTEAGERMQVHRGVARGSQAATRPQS